MAKGYIGVCPRGMTNECLRGAATTHSSSYLPAMQTCLIHWWNCYPEAKLTMLRWKATAQGSFAFTAVGTQVKQDNIGQAGWQQFGHPY